MSLSIAILWLIGGIVIGAAAARFTAYMAQVLADLRRLLV